MPNNYDFSGYATRNNIRCSDGRTIRRNAFIDNDGMTVPLVWMHRHNEPSNVLGHVLLENRDDGVYAYGSFNDTAEGQRAKSLVKHGDIKQMSIYANQLRQSGDGDVMHGVIREVSLVLSGANPGAYIQTLDIQHADDPDYDEEYDAEIYTGENFALSHSDKSDAEEEKKRKLMKKKPEVVEVEIDSEDDEDMDDTDDVDDMEEETEEIVKKEPAKKKLKHAATNDNKEEKDMPTKKDSEKTVQDVFNELTEEQKNVVYFMIGEAIKSAGGKNDKDDEAKHYDEEEDALMHTNLFENNSRNDEFLAHAEEFFSEESTESIFKDAKRLGSLREAVLAHAEDYGIKDIEYLFPDPKTLTNQPDIISADQAAVKAFMDRVRKSPFARIKSVHADITETEARAKGYTKGKKKLDEVFKLLKRTTTPTTVYKKQSIDRDDVLDITDFDVVAFLRAEMRVKLDEELVRAFLVGDGRTSMADDKISETNIRPIWKDDDLYTIKSTIAVSADASEDQIAKEVINGIIRARKSYRGSGNPDFYTSEDVLTSMLLLTDGVGRDLYETVDKLATKLRVSKIVTSEFMENQTRTGEEGDGDANSKTLTLYGIIVNPADYNVGTDRGGAVTMFDDFDIDYNKQKYLIETRCSGALVKPYSAIAVEVYTKA